MNQTENQTDMENTGVVRTELTPKFILSRIDFVYDWVWVFLLTSVVAACVYRAYSHLLVMEYPQGWHFIWSAFWFSLCVAILVWIILDRRQKVLAGKFQILTDTVVRKHMEQPLAEDCDADSGTIWLSKYQNGRFRSKGYDVDRDVYLQLLPGSPVYLVALEGKLLDILPCEYYSVPKKYAKTIGKKPKITRRKSS